MSRPLSGLLQHVLTGEPEPELAAEVDTIFRRADRLRRRRTQALIGAGLGTVTVIVAGGYLLATTMLPAERRPAAVAPPGGRTPSAVATPSAVTDKVLAVLGPAIDKKELKIFPRPPERGNGWRQYEVLDAEGRPRGTVEIAVYQVADDLCFPVLSSPGSCASTEWAPKGVEYVRYDDEKDPGWQVHQTTARRITDGRTLAVMATGERDAGAELGKPALTGKQVEELATDQRLFDAFGPDETCTGPSAGACPAFRVPVPVED